ncbi:lysophospholipase [Candidatus Woesearchaeota archaeon]|nr:lysophospholipase [Candidatus Woesearchaeota archaeon]
MKQEKVEFRNSKVQKLVGVMHIHEKKTDKIAIYVHGYRSSKESSKAVYLGKSLPEKKIVLFRIDLSGRGESDGKFEDTTITQYIDDLRCAIDFAENSGYKKLSVIGNSLGGLVSLQEVSIDDRVKCLALLSPVPKFQYKGRRNEFSDEGIAKWKKQGWIYTYSPRYGEMKINYSYLKDLSKYDNLSVYDNIKIPVLVLHGTKDEAISIKGVKELVKHLENSEFIILKGADHDYTISKKQFDKAMNETSRFLEESLK